ncbi:MAG: SRPBCC family protein [Phycisphaerales bacterium]|nr:SRPBCC family protein [Phycisphaerales bacterium]
MARYADNVLIARSPPEVFGYVSDLANAPDWMPHVRLAEPVAPPEAGSESGWRVIRAVGGAEPSTTMQVVEYHGPGMAAPPYRLAFRTKVAGVEVTYRYRFLPAGAERTRVELAVESVGKGLIGSLMSLPVARSLRREEAGQLARLRTVLEGC